MFTTVIIILFLIAVMIWSAGRIDRLTATYEGQPCRELKISVHIIMFIISSIMLMTVVGIMSGKIGRSERRYPASGWRIENEIVFRNGHSDTTYVMVRK